VLVFDPLICGEQIMITWTTTGRKLNKMDYRPGHGFVLHFRVSFASPAQFFPPWAGFGLVQVRVLLCDPPPQALSHFGHAEYALHPPSTNK